MLIKQLNEYCFVLLMPGIIRSEELGVLLSTRLSALTITFSSCLAKAGRHLTAIPDSANVPVSSHLLTTAMNLQAGYSQGDKYYLLRPDEESAENGC